MNNSKLPRVNKEIRAERVRLVDENGEMIGIVEIREAVTMAFHKKLDLVEISPNAEPPVCKLMDFGKYKYDIQKKETDARKKSKALEIKEMRFTVNIGEHDYVTKVNRIKSFLSDGHHVKILATLKGRDRAHSERVKMLFDRIIADCAEHSAVMNSKVNLTERGGDFTLAAKKK